MRYSQSTSSLKRNKRATFGFLFLFLFIYMWILFGGNTWNADYNNYLYIYNSIAQNQNGVYPSIEIGYQFVCKIGSSIGLSYNGFLIIYSFIGLSLIASTARKYSNNYTLMFILYFIYPFVVDVAQVRNFMAMALVIFATRYLTINENQAYVKYFIFILLASTFHYSSLFYLLFLLVKIKSYKKLICLTLVMVLIGFLTRSMLPTIIGQFLNIERYGFYLSQSIVFSRVILFFIYFFVSAALTYYVFRRIGLLHQAEMINSEQFAFAEVVMKINILIFIAYVLVLGDENFLRLFRNILPLNYILFSMIKPKYRFTNNPIVLFHSMNFFGFVILSSATVFFLNYDDVIYPIFNNNFILDYLKR